MNKCVRPTDENRFLLRPSYYIRKYHHDHNHVRGRAGRVFVSAVGADRRIGQLQCCLQSAHYPAMHVPFIGDLSYVDMSAYLFRHWYGG